MNFDLMNSKRAEILAAIEKGDTEKYVDLMIELGNSAKDEVAAMYDELKNVTDEKILAARGIKKLTSEEEEFYNSLAMNVKNEGEGLTNLSLTLPVTVVNRVFEEIATEHPLLSKIEFVDTKGLTQWIMTTGVNGIATWGDLCDAVTAKAGAEFGALTIDLKKLTVAMPVCLTAIELGMVWLDRYVRTVLGELIADALCDAIINGTGAKMPIGMTKVIAGAGQTQTIPAADKQAAAITNLDVATLGGIVAELTNGGKRVVNRMLMIVNPTDNANLVAPAITTLNALGQYEVRIPKPVDIVEDVHVPAGKAIFGLAKNYWAGAGLGKEPKITYSDEFKFLDDVRWYKAKVVANGQPRDNASFVVKDITGLLPKVIIVKEVQ